MQELQAILKTANEVEDVITQVQTLVDISAWLIEHDDKHQAVEILALARCYPMLEETCDYATELFHQLDADLSPQVIAAARRHTREWTLDDLVQRIITTERE
jgi:hypothetical protein